MKPRKALPLILVLLVMTTGGTQAQNLIVSGETVVIDSPLTVDGEVVVEDGGTLILRNTTLTLELDFDEEHHVDISGGSKFVVEDSVITSSGGQYWIELYAADGASPVMEVTGNESWITNHSGIRPYDETFIKVTGGDVEELQVHDRAVVELTDAATYPVFFFDGIVSDISSLDTGTSISNTITTSGGWTFSMTNAFVEGYQIDLMNGARVSLTDGEGIVVSIHSPGNLGDQLRVIDGVTSPVPKSGSITGLGSDLFFTSSSIALINLYVSGSDRVLVRSSRVNEVNASAGSELIVGQKGFQTPLLCNLCQVYDSATFTVVNATIDASENLPSATSSYSDLSEIGSGIMSFVNMDLRELDLAARDHGVLNLYNCTIDENRLEIIDSTAVVNRASLRAGFTATRLSGAAPLTVEFLDLSAGEISSWMWDFGDGTTSSQAQPTHVYTTNGSYTVKLTVEDSGGSDIAVREAYVRVEGGSSRRRTVRRPGE